MHLKYKSQHVYYDKFREKIKIRPKSVLSNVNSEIKITMNSLKNQFLKKGINVEDDATTFNIHK